MYFLIFSYIFPIFSYIFLEFPIFFLYFPIFFLYFSYIFLYFPIFSYICRGDQGGRAKNIEKCPRQFCWHFFQVSFFKWNFLSQYPIRKNPDGVTVQDRLYLLWTVSGVYQNTASNKKTETETKFWFTLSGCQSGLII